MGISTFKHFAFIWSLFIPFMHWGYAINGVDRMLLILLDLMACPLIRMFLIRCRMCWVFYQSRSICSDEKAMNVYMNVNPDVSKRDDQVYKCRLFKVKQGQRHHALHIFVVGNKWAMNCHWCYRKCIYYIKHFFFLISNPLGSGSWRARAGKRWTMGCSYCCAVGRNHSLLWETH